MSAMMHNWKKYAGKLLLLFVFYTNQISLRRLKLKNGRAAMSTFLPKDVQADLDASRIAALKKLSRLRVEAGGETYPVLRQWDGGFSVEVGAVPFLRGFVDLYDGTRHLAQCLIIASEEEGGEMRYDFKRATQAVDSAPLDFYRAPDAPAGLLEKS